MALRVLWARRAISCTRGHAQRFQLSSQCSRCAVNARQRRAEQHRAARCAQCIVRFERENRRHVMLQPFQHAQQAGDLNSIAREIGAKPKFPRRELGDLGIEIAFFLFQRFDACRRVDKLPAQLCRLRAERVALNFGGFDRGPRLGHFLFEGAILIGRARHSGSRSSRYCAGQIGIRGCRRRTRGRALRRVTDMLCKRRSYRQRDDGSDAQQNCALEKSAQPTRSADVLAPSISECPAISRGFANPIKLRSVGAAGLQP